MSRSQSTHDGVVSAAGAGANAATATVVDDPIEAAQDMLRRPSMIVVYWAAFVAVMVLSLAFTLLVTNALFRLRIFIAPGPVMLLGVFCIVSLAAGAALAWGFIRSTIRPIVEMSDAAQRIAHGDYDIELKERTIAREVTRMADSFTEMAHELSSTEIMRSDFVSNVSHEIKTPIAAVEGYATLLQNPQITPTERAAYTDKILNNTRRLSKLTDNVLLLSQLENRDAELERVSFSLDEQLREAILLYEDSWVDGRRAMDIDLDTVDFCGNADLLAHVWHNLIGNAMKFTSAGDEVRVSLRALPADEDAPARVEVRVADSGIGMEPEECARVFEKFYQADRSRATEGNGLGLALAKRIVDLHEGSISAASELGRGTVITVILPQVEMPPQPES